jgi:tetratricopeptide (TPR) repeat protein
MLITFVAYTPVWRAGFIWDDKDLLLDNRMVKASDGLYRFWFTTEAPDYYPLTWSLWWLEWRAWSRSAAGYHAVNLLLHTANVVLLWLVLRRLKIPGAWLAGLVFAIHPVNVATVAWISEQKNTLSMLFYTVAILLYLRFDEEGRWHWYGLSLVAFLLALLSKTAVVMLPIVLLGCIWWRRGSIRGKDVMRSVPFFACSLILGLVTVWFQYYRAMEGTTTRTDGFLSRLVTAGWVPWFYLYKALWPFHLAVVYPKWNVNASLWASYVPGVVMLGCLGLFWRNRKTWGRPLLFAMGYYIVTLFPVLGFFDQGFYEASWVADHWQYFAIVGVIAMVVATAEAMWRRTGKWGRYVGLLMAVTVLMVLGVATWRRSSVYADSQTLWRDTLAKNPNAWIAHNNLGNDLAEQGKAQEAIEQFEETLRARPDYARGHHNLGSALREAGRVQDAMGQYEEALRINPDFAEAHNNLGVALVQVGRVQEAIPHFEQALRIKPDFADALNNLGRALLQGGRVQDAINHYEQALRTNPDSAGSHCSLANALLTAGNVHDAISHYEQALRIKPDLVEAHNNLGDALLQVGRVQDAISHFQQALRIQPDLAAAKHNLARARALH